MAREAEPSTKYPSSPPPGAASSPPPSGASSPPPSGASPLPSAFPPEARPRQPTISPGDLDQLTESYAARQAEGGFSPETSIQSLIFDLEQWARSIARQERVDAIRAWLLKGIAFFGAVATAGGGALAMPRVSIAAGIITAIAIAVDAAWPASGDKNARQRAIHDLRELQHTVNLKWEKVRLAHPDPAAVKRVAHALALLDSAHSRREHIGSYLSDASPAVRGTGDTPGS